MSGTLLVAACSSTEEASRITSGPVPATAATTSSTATPTTSTSTSTTVVPATTAAPSASETTTIPPAPATTAAPVPTGDPTDQAIPLFAGSNDDAWLYLGRWSGAGWEPARTPDGAVVDPAIPAGTEFRLSELGAVDVAGTAGPSDAACADARLGPVISPNAGVPDLPGYGYRAVALPSAWTLRPRQAAIVDVRLPEYTDAGRAAFADTGVETGAGEIDQTVVTDLDGDGDTEALVVFGHENEPAEGTDGVPVGYSAVLLINPDTGAIAEVAKSFTPAVDGVFQNELFETYRILDVLDANGDGIMELVLHRWFPDSASVSLHSYDGATLTEVLIAGCSR